MGTLPLNVSLAPAPEAAAEAARDAGCDQLSTKLQSTDDRIPYRDPYEDFIGESRIGQRLRYERHHHTCKLRPGCVHHLQVIFDALAPALA